MQWHPEASERINQYLDEVRRACADRGMDPESVANQVYSRIVAQALASGASEVSDDLVRGILAAYGPAENQLPVSVPPPLPPAGAYRPPLPQPPVSTAAGSQKWKGSSSAGIGCIIAGAVGFGLFSIVGILAAILLPALARAREAAWRAACQNNLKQVGLLLQMHANEHEGRYPGWVNEPGYLIFPADVVAEQDPAIFQCPAEDTNYAGEREDGSFSLDSDYLYLGFALRSQEDVEALVQAVGALDYDLAALCAQAEQAPVDGGLELLRANLSDPASVPVLVEWDSNHSHLGANVLYLDGHTEFIRHGAKFPVTDEFYDAIKRMLN